MTGGSITNTIMYGNSASTATNIYQAGGSIGNCCSPDLMPGGLSSNINGDPLFVDFSLRDYQLFAGSPCVDAGRDRAWMLDALDLIGNARIERLRVDMGAFENVPPPGTILLVR